MTMNVGTPPRKKSDLRKPRRNVEKRQKKVESNRQKLTNSVEQEVYNGSNIHTSIGGDGGR